VHVLSEALRWLDLGVAPVPCAPAAKIPLMRWTPWRERLPDRRLVIEWFKGSRPLNLAFVVPTWLVVVDFDNRAAYGRWLATVGAAAAYTYTVNTNRGFHLYYRVAEPVATFGAPDVDVLGVGHLVMAPPSRHPSGAYYEVLRDLPLLSITSPLELGLEPAPHPVRAASGREFDPADYIDLRDVPGEGLYAQVKRALPLLVELSWYTTPLQSGRDGRWYVMRCPHPAHEDRKPSFWCDAQLEVCGCFKPECRATQPGNGLPMDQINLHAWLHQLRNGAAIVDLARRLGLR